MSRWNQSLCLIGLLVVGVFACTDSAQASLIALNNPGFESPTLADGESVAGLPVDWTRVSDEGDRGTINPTSSYFAPEAHGGQNVAYLGENTWMQYYTTETFQEGVTYTFSVYAGFSGSGSGTGNIQIRDIDADDPMVSDNFIISNDSWYLQTISYTASGNAVGHGIGILIRGLSDGYILYDDVTLTPEPATMGLLLFGGGLALARRRVQR